MKPLHYRRFVDIHQLPSQLILAPAQCICCLLLQRWQSTFIVDPCTEKIIDSHLALGLPLINHGVLSTQSTTSVNAKPTCTSCRVCNMMKLLPPFYKAEACKVVKNQTVACCSLSLCEYITTTWVTEASALNIPSMASRSSSCSLLLLMSVLSLLT